MVEDKIYIKKEVKNEVIEVKQSLKYNHYANDF